MRTKSSLLCGAAIGVMLAVGMGAAAEAKTSKKHHHKEAAAAPAPASAEEVKALSDEIESLKARLDQESLARENTEAKAQAAQAEAEAAKADAQAAHAQLAEQIQTIPGEVKSAVVANTPKPGWWGDTKVGALVFADASYIDQKTSNAKPTTPLTNASNAFPTENGYGVDIKRAYLIVDHTFNDTYSANLTTDFTYDSTTKATQLYIKKAYLQAKYNDALVLRLGDTDMPWVPFVENVYGYRYVENVMIDRLKYGTSADTGLTASGVLPYKPGFMGQPVSFGYSIAAVDGNGYKAPGTGNANRSEYMDLEGRLNANVGGFTAAIGGYEGFLGKDVNGSAKPAHTANRFDGLLAYTNDRFRLGAEYVYVQNYTGVTTAKPPRPDGNGYSAFGSVVLVPKVALFGRYEWVAPEQDVLATTNKTNSAAHDTYFNVGVSYTPVKSVDLALVYKRESVSDGLLTTANGAASPTSTAPQGSGIIGGISATGLLRGGYYDEFGIFTRYSF